MTTNPSVGQVLASIRDDRGGLNQLTVIDPFVAVVLGITILGEATGAPLWSLLLLAAAGAVAVWGVIDLARAQQRSASDAALGG